MLLWVPWIGHYFHLTPSDMLDITLTQYIEMHDAKGGFGEDA